MKQEVRRGRKFVEYHDPDTQDKRTFTQEISGADVSYQDEGGAWQQLVEDWETDGADGFSFRAARMNHKVRFDSIGAWRWYPRRNVETEYLVINRPQCWLTATKRWGNLLVNGISREGKTITLTSVRNVTRVIHSRWNGIKTDWILLNANAPTRFRQKIDLVGITEIAGVLYGADGQRLGQLMPTSATDANGAELPCTDSYSGGYIEFSADVTGAAFPVVIDPDFAGGTADKLIYGQADGNYSTARATSSGENNSDTYMGVGQRILSVTYFRCTRLYFLFDTSAIGASSTVTQVNLKLVAFNDYSDTDFDLIIMKQDWSSGTREEHYDGCLAGTQDDSIFKNSNPWVKNTAYTSGNLATAWVNKTGTTYYSIISSRDLAGTQNTGNEFVEVYSQNIATAGYRPVLSVTYTTAAAGNPHYYYAQL